MKKKFLSLMMAAAVVATTSVSAFAADNVDASVENPKSANVIAEDNQDRRTEVTITGKIADQDGTMPVANFKVTVPTSASFTVNKDGILVGPSLEIKNEGPQAIEVYAQRFMRVNGGNGDIKTVKEDDIKGDVSGNQYDRSNVALKLKGEIVNGEGEEVVAFLAAKDDGGSGIYSDKELGSQSKTGIKLLALGAGNTKEQTGTIKLDGVAGKGRVTGGAKSDKFQLTLRIKKANTQ